MSETYGEPMSRLDDMMAWEDGTLGDQQTVTLFQSLIDSGLAWRLQGCYGRQAAAMIKQGLCRPAGVQHA